MLGSFYIHLRPLTPARTDRHVGRWLNGLLYHLVEALDAALAAELHEQLTLKPFTVSGLLGPLREEGHAAYAMPDQTHRVRYTVLGPALLQALSQSPLSRYLEQRTLTIGQRDFELLRVEMAPHSTSPWLGTTSYEALHTQPRPTREITFDFASSTAFRCGEQSFLFPVPESVFHSLYRTWRAFYNIPLPDDLWEFVRQSVAAARYELRTEVIEAGRYKLLGFVGRCTYHLEIVVALELLYDGRARRSWARDLPCLGGKECKCSAQRS